MHGCLCAASYRYIYVSCIYVAAVCFKLPLLGAQPMAMAMPDYANALAGLAALTADMGRPKATTVLKGLSGVVARRIGKGLPKGT